MGVLLGFLVALPFAIGLTIYEGESFNQITAKGWMAVTYVGLFEMGITFVLWLSALKLTNNTARISNLIFASPFISLMLLSTIIGRKFTRDTIWLDADYCWPCYPADQVGKKKKQPQLKLMPRKIRIIAMHLLRVSSDSKLLPSKMASHMTRHFYVNWN